ncbi:MAG: TIGR04255 family protein [Methylophilaceae bacterium]
MTTSLPIKLNKEPLIDAVFEVRFTSQIPASIILPGILYNILEGEKKLDSLPISQLPKEVRDADPNLKYSPISRIDWKSFFINISDNSLSISSKHPYAGWKIFKPAIIEVINILNSSNIVQSLERCAVKYVDMLPISKEKQIASMFNLNLDVAGHKLVQEAFQIRIEIPKNGFIHAVHIISSAKATLHTGESREGAIIDIDSIHPERNVPMELFLENFSDKLEELHTENKAKFFECLSTETLKSLEPTYE